MLWLSEAKSTSKKRTVLIMDKKKKPLTGQTSSNLYNKY